MKRQFVYVVMYVESNGEPNFTIFDNEEAADKYYKYTKAKHGNCFIEKCETYSVFMEF